MEKGVYPITMLEFFFGRILFRDPARPVEILSALGLAGWTAFMLGFPDIVAARAGYASFSWMPPHAWAALMGGICLLQLITIFLRLPVKVKAETRFAAMALSAGIWAVIAVAFWSSGTQSTAHWNYTSIALLCSLTGMYLGWAAKTS